MLNFDPGTATSVHEMLTFQLIRGEITPVEARQIYVRFYGRADHIEREPISVLDHLPEVASSLNDMEKQEIEAALRVHHYHMSNAARSLGICRKTLRDKANRYKISLPLRKNRLVG